ncbi:MAG: thymidine phosphorylase [Synergistaceae bacterium]|jgi:pyrimidine-nucleoside phosphorylase|nr:thymidine phosphorylase [Synergistaceae bacterium]
MLDVIEFIEHKRDGFAHCAAELREFVIAVRDGAIPDYQAAAWLMAVFFRGLDKDELRFFTDALAHSGDIVRLPGSLGVVVDKHSTGGVGDKTTLIVAPLAAACGLRVAKLSGRGLGFTGGTVDKLESIPGMNMCLSAEQFVRQAEELGIALSGHSLALAPAEGRFYALRDVTGAVPSLPLIASSIVSKKIAGGADAIVFDVKCGGGAFMNTLPEAEELSRTLVGLSRSLGKKSVCLISDMDSPLGEWVGNSVEVLEAIEVLSGRGPRDTRELSLALVSEMLLIGGIAGSVEEAAKIAGNSLDDGAGFRKFEEVIRSQGGDASVCAEPEKILRIASKKKIVASTRSGILGKMDARAIGYASRALGGGRFRKDDAIDPSVGLRILKKKGDRVGTGEPLIEIFYNDERQLEKALPYLETISGEAVTDTAVEAARRTVLGRVA